MRCFTCGKVVGNKWEQYINLLSADYSEMDALNALGLRRYCCRRMLLSHVDLIEKLLNYNSQRTNTPLLTLHHRITATYWSAVHAFALCPSLTLTPPLLSLFPRRRHGKEDHHLSARRHAPGPSVCLLRSLGVTLRC